MNIKYIASKIFKKARLSSIKNSSVDSTSKIESGSLFVGSIMDKHSFCGYDCEIINTVIGSYCSIGNNVKIGGGEHPISWVSTSPVFYEGRDSVSKKFSQFKREPLKKTIIENDVWIGQNALIRQGVNIGTGAVIGMGSIVTKDVTPYSIVAGNPAKILRYRFEDSVIDGLLKTKWWELDDKDLTGYANLIQNPIEFIKSLSKKINEL